MKTLIEGGTLVLHDETPREVITGSAAQLHSMHQAPQRFANREAFDDPGYEKLFMSVRVAPTGRPGASIGWSSSTRRVRCRRSRSASSRVTGV